MGGHTKNPTIRMFAMAIPGTRKLSSWNMMPMNYHQNYFANNPHNAYCSAVIQLKLYKFAKEFSEKIRPELL